MTGTKAELPPMWEHQQEAFDFAIDKPSAMIAHTMGAGKSRTAVTLAEASGKKNILVVCPVSVMRVWPGQLSKHAPGIFHPFVCDSGTTDVKAKAAHKHAKWCGIEGRRSVVVINYDSVWRGLFGELASFLNWDMVIYDEIHRLKTPGGTASKFCWKALSRVPVKLGLTGTVMPHSPMDVFAQYRALDDSIFGRYITHFRNRYAVMGGYGRHKVLGFRDTDDMKQRMDTITHYFSKEQLAAALDMPPELDVEIPVALSPKNKKTYQELEKQFYVEVDDGEVTASNALVKLLRLQEITSGHLTVTGAHDIKKKARLGSEKAKALADVLESSSKPAVVFARFTEDLNIVREVAESLGMKYGELSGRANDLTENATIPKWVEVLGVNLQAGGVGVDFSEASTGIYYSLGYSLGDYLQSRARLHRPPADGVETRNNVVFVHLLATGTVDMRVYGALKKRLDVISAILNKDV